MSERINLTYYREVFEMFLPPKSMGRHVINLFCFFKKNIITPLEEGKEYWGKRAVELLESFSKRDIRATSERNSQSSSSRVSHFDEKQKSDPAYVLGYIQQRIADKSESEIHQILHDVFNKIDPSLRKDEQFILDVLAANEENYVILYSIDDSLINFDFMRKAFKENKKTPHNALKLFIQSKKDESMRQACDDFSLEVIKELKIDTPGKWCMHFNTFLRNGEEFFKYNANNPLTIKYALEHFVHYEYSTSRKEFAKFFNSSIDKRLKNDQELMLLAAKRDIRLLENLGKTLRENRDFFRKAAKHNIQALEYASEELKADKSFVDSLFRQNDIIHLERKSPL